MLFIEAFINIVLSWAVLLRFSGTPEQNFVTNNPKHVCAKMGAAQHGFIKHCKSLHTDTGLTGWLPSIYFNLYLSGPRGGPNEIFQTQRKTEWWWYVYRVVAINPSDPEKVLPITTCTSIGAAKGTILTLSNLFLTQDGVKNASRQEIYDELFRQLQRGEFPLRPEKLILSSYSAPVYPHSYLQVCPILQCWFENCPLLGSHRHRTLCQISKRI